jgi:hypothetical protein
MDEPRTRRDGHDEEPSEGPAQRRQPGPDDGGAADPPADPDRPTDEVRRGNTLVEPSPGD